MIEKRRSTSEEQRPRELLTFNQFLATDVRLARHKGRTPAQCRKMRDRACALDVGFARYQERRGDPNVIKQCREAKYIAGFISEPLTRQTVFFGVSERTALSCSATRSQSLGQARRIRSISAALHVTTRRLSGKFLVHEQARA